MATLKLGKNVIRPSGHPDEGSSKRQPNPYFASNRYVYGSGLSYPYFASNSYGNGNGFAGVRLKGLPFNCSETDIIIFFVGLDIINIFLVKNISGEAFVVFTTQLQVKYALCRDKQYMRQRYIEVFRCEEKEYYDAVTSGYKVLRLQGLPFTVKKNDIVEFFKDFEIAEDKVQIVCGADGIPSGDAFVEFVSGEVAKRAMCKDRQTIGSRYVILFFSTPDEAERTVSKFRQ